MNRGPNYVLLEGSQSKSQRGLRKASKHWQANEPMLGTEKLFDMCLTCLMFRDKQRYPNIMPVIPLNKRFAESGTCLITVREG
eukprot:6454812-Amphidinium_carterae.1